MMLCTGNNKWLNYEKNGEYLASILVFSFEVEFCIHVLVCRHLLYHMNILHIDLRPFPHKVFVIGCVLLHKCRICYIYVYIWYAPFWDFDFKSWKIREIVDPSGFLFRHTVDLLSDKIQIVRSSLPFWQFSLLYCRITHRN